ncbi:MAG: ankyrin repeat domain-containing protein [Synergistaceae bacterium]|nr:ankyrin repeat domain-containing protein [Synergistaceae bacterium]
MAMTQREFLYLCARGNAEQIQLAIIEGASVNRRAKFMGSSVPPLFVAVIEKNYDAVKVLIKHKAKCIYGFVAIMMNEDEDMLRFMIDCGADINCCDSHNRTPLLYALNTNKVKLVQWFLELGADANYRASAGFNALTYAAFMYNEQSEIKLNKKIIELLMDAGSEYDEAMMTAIKLHNTELAQVLLDYGIDVNEKFINDQSLLSIAILNLEKDKNMDMVKLFIKNGADVNEILDFGDGVTTSNLNIAISLSATDAAELLLENGADPNFIDSKGRLPLMYAVLTSLEMVEVLLRHGADPDIGDKEGRTPLMLAVIDSETEAGVIKALLESGANPDIQDSSGHTALMWTIIDHDREPELFTAALIRTGAIRAEHGAEWFSTASLFAAAKREVQLQTVKTLIEYGADLSIKDKKGLNAFMFAVMNFDEEIADILKSAGGFSEPIN